MLFSFKCCGNACSFFLFQVLSSHLPFACSIYLCLVPQGVANLTIREQSLYAIAGTLAEEVLSSIRTVAVFGGEDHEAERWASLLLIGLCVIGLWLNFSDTICSLIKSRK